jgi:hypothetical protein
MNTKGSTVVTRIYASDLRELAALSTQSSADTICKLIEHARATGWRTDEIVHRGNRYRRIEPESAA